MKLASPCGESNAGVRTVEREDKPERNQNGEKNNED